MPEPLLERIGRADLPDNVAAAHDQSVAPADPVAMYQPRLVLLLYSYNIN